MTAKELMSPRYEIILSYPNCPFNVGDVLHRIQNATNEWFHTNTQNYAFHSTFAIHLETIEKHPHIFRLMDWWEKRNIEDMPRRLICKAIPNDTEIMEIVEWDMEILVGWLNKEDRKCCSLLSFNPEYGYFPVD